MQIKSQEDLTQAVWINCNRISTLGNVSLYYISCGEKGLPGFYIKFLNKFFETAEGYNSFFSDTNKRMNFRRFKTMLNDIGYFTVQDILINGPLSKREHLGVIPVEEVAYEG